jgi:hypothetical protein
MVDEGSTVGTFTTSPPPTSIRFTGYVDEWPLVWPDGSSAASTMSITASSRRARMGNTAPLTSAIRAAYLADDPISYWPMDEDVEFSQVLPNGVVQQLYRDITNSADITKNNSLLGSWFETAAFAPVVRDGLPGPTDEQGLVKVPATTDPANPDWLHYIGGSSVTRFGTNLSPTTGCTFEMLARVAPVGNGNEQVDLARVFVGNTYTDEFKFGLYNNGTDKWLYCGVRRRDDSGAIIEDPTFGFGGTAEENRAAYDRAVDGEIHHYSIDVSDNGALLYFDGEWVAYAIFASNTFTQPFRTVTMCSRTLYADVWVGHAAAYDEALGTIGLGANLLHAAAATAANETETERVVRVAGRVGVPSAEVDVETSVAMPLGPQSEAGRGAAEVLDELAVSTGGVLYDTRAGHLALQARNHRYNTSAAFTLNATTQEVAADLTATLDDRYLTNDVQMTRSGDTENIPRLFSDDTSIGKYGYYSKSLQIVSSSDNEVDAAALDHLARYSTPKVRISQVSVDLVNVADAQRIALLAADIGTMFNISNLPAQAPTDPMSLFVEGYTETLSATTHTLTINTTPAGQIYTNVAILDDAAHDVLGSGIVLAY